MPSHLPSSFASAAAGNTSTQDSAPNGRGAVRGDNTSSGDWYVYFSFLLHAIARKTLVEKDSMSFSASLESLLDLTAFGGFPVTSWAQTKQRIYRARRNEHKFV